MSTPSRYTLSAAKSVSPLDAIDSSLRYEGRTINVHFGDWGTRGRSDDQIAPGTSTVPVSEGFTAYERQQFQTAFDVIEDYIDLRFETVATKDEADFVLLLDTNQFTGSSLGYFYLPNGIQQYGVFNGAEWDRTKGGDLAIGGLGFVTIVHEVLHGLGLDHPQDGEVSEVMLGVNSRFDSYGVANLNQGLYTTMTYNDGYQAGPVGTRPPRGADYGNQAGPMALDIAVLQQKYGARTGTNAGDTVYELDRTNDTGTHWLAIWDTGGTDTIRLDGGRDAVIDLRDATLEYEQGGGGYVSAADNIAGGFTIANGVVIENAIGGGGDDVLRGNGADNDLRGNAGDDTLTGGGGFDRAIYGGAGADLTATRISGGWRIVSDDEGTDDLFDIDRIVARDGLFAPEDLIFVEQPEVGPEMPGTHASDGITGTGMSEMLKGFAGDDTLIGSGGHDTLDGGIGFDDLRGGAGNDRLLGANGFDRLAGDDGDDTLDGGYGNDTLFGGAGDDVLNGGLGFDSMEGGDGDDRLDGLDGYDTLRGGEGRDVLNGNAGNDALYGDGGADTLNGGIGADLLDGGRDADVLIGGNGADTLLGGAGDDVLSGNAGDDRIAGGAGDDRLMGGIGADTFVFAPGGGRDTVMDLGIVDRIALDIDLLDPGTTIASHRTTVDGNLAFDFGGGDVLVLFGYDRVEQVASLVELI